MDPELRHRGRAPTVVASPAPQEEEAATPRRPSGYRTYTLNVRQSLSDRFTNGVQQVRALPWSKWADDAWWWLRRKRKTIAKLVTVIAILLVFFYAWHCSKVLSMSQEEYMIYMYGEEVSMTDKHLSGREEIRKVTLGSATITPRRYHTYADVDASMFKSCQLLSADDFASGMFILNLRDDTRASTIQDFRDGNSGDDAPSSSAEGAEVGQEGKSGVVVDHVVVTLEEMRETNERLLDNLLQEVEEEERDQVMLMMIPKFWNVTSPEEAEILERAAFNPCMISARLPGGLVVTVFNPVATNEVYAADNEQYAHKTLKRLHSGPEDTFPFWDRVASFYNVLRLRYNEWPARVYDKPTITEFRGVEAIYFQIYLQYLSATNLFEDMMASR